MNFDPKNLSALAVSLHNRRIGVINRMSGDRYLFSFEQDYIEASAAQRSKQVAGQHFDPVIHFVHQGIDPGAVDSGGVDIDCRYFSRILCRNNGADAGAGAHVHMHVVHGLHA